MRSMVFLAIVIGLSTSYVANGQQGDWVNLFDGETLEGWTQRGGKAGYQVENGMIVGTTVPNTANSFLCTESDYSNFELQLEFKVHPELNSGVQIRSISDPEINNGRVHGYQVEIDPSRRAWSCGIYDEGRRGWLFDLKDNAPARYAFRQNDWNHYRISATGDTIQTWINGVAAARLTDDMTASGFIALQVHGVGGRKDPISVKWRNIRIRTFADDVQPDPATGDRETGTPAFVDTEFNVKQLAKGFRFTEGPTPGPDGNIYFTDIPARQVWVYSLDDGEASVVHEDSGAANGLAWTPNDSLIACEGGARRVSVRHPDGNVTTIVDQFEGKQLNSPNDLTLDGVGGFYFTDPRYGNRDNLELDVEGVYYVNRGNKISRVIDDVERPNGIELSQDGKTLYVSDTSSNNVFAYDVQGPGKVANKRLFAAIGSDGMNIDDTGNLYLTHGMFVHIYRPDGEALCKIAIPEAPANVTFGGPDRSLLFVTARNGLYSVEMNVAGGREFANPDFRRTP